MSDSPRNLPKIGDIIDGRFRIESILETSTYRTVFKAKHEMIGRLVALEFLSPQVLNNQDAVERFRREALHVSQLRHPNTVTLYDYGQTTDGLVFMVLEYLTGKRLSYILQHEGSLALPRAAYIFIQVLKSLCEAHDFGIVHSDLKPFQIMLCDMFHETEFVKVLSYGFGRIAFQEYQSREQENDSKHATSQASSLFMSPEQKRGDLISPAADVYSAGLLLLCMLSSDVHHFEVLKNKGTDTQSITEYLPPHLSKLSVGPIIMKATADDPENRYPNARVFLSIFKEALREMDIIPEPMQWDHGAGRLEVNKNINYFNDLSGQHQRFEKEEVEFHPDIELSDEELKALNYSGYRYESNVEPKENELTDSFGDPQLSGQPRRPLVTVNAFSAKKADENDDICSKSTENFATSEMTPLEEESLPCVVASDPTTYKRQQQDTFDNVDDQNQYEVPVDLRDEWRRRRELNQQRAVSNSERVRPSYVGREAEIDVFVSQISAAINEAHTQVFIIKGASGVGKTRLIDEVSQRLHRKGYDICVGQCLSNPLPLGPIRDILRQLWGLSDADPNEFEQIVLEELQEAALPPSEIQKVLSFFAPETNGLHAENISEIFPTLITLFVSAARTRPLVLIFEDVQGIDTSTTAFFEKLALEVHDLSVPIVIGAAILPEEVISNAELERSIQFLKQTLKQPFLIYRLGGLSNANMNQILDSVLMLDTTLRERITWLSQGNPLYALQILEHLRTSKLINQQSDGRWYLTSNNAREFDLPPDLLQLMRIRLESAINSNPAHHSLRQLLEWMAVLGIKFPKELIYRVAGASPSIQADLNYLTSQGLVLNSFSKGVEYIEFVTTLLRQVILIDLEERHAYARLNANAAEAKYQYYTDNQLEVPAVEIAEHWHKAGDINKYKLFLYVSAERARKRGDIRGAKRQFLELADVYKENPSEHAIPRIVKIDYALAELAWDSGQFGVAEDHFAEAIELASEHDTCDIDISIGIRGLAHLSLLKGHIERARELYQQALSFSTKNHDCVGEAKALIGISKTYLFKADLKSEHEYSQKLVNELDQISDNKLKGKIATHLACIKLAEGDIPAQFNYLDIAREAYEKGTDLVGLVDCLLEQATALLYTHCSDPDAYTKVEDLIERAESINKVTRNRFRVFEVERVRALFETNRGNYELAKQLAEHAKENYLKAHFPFFYVALCRITLGRIASYTGNYSVAERELQQAVLIFIETNDRLVASYAMNYLADNYISMDNYARAHSVLDKVLSLLKQLSTECCLFDIQWRFAMLDIGEGRCDDAIKRLGNYLRLSNNPEFPSYKQQPSQSLISICQSLISVALALKSEFDEARKHAQSALQIAISINRKNIEAFVTANTSVVARLCGDSELAEKLGEKHIHESLYLSFLPNAWLQWMIKSFEISIKNSPEREAKELQRHLFQLIKFFDDHMIAE